MERGEKLPDEKGIKALFMRGTYRESSISLTQLNREVMSKVGKQVNPKGFTSYVKDANENVIHTIQAKDATDCVDQFIAFLNSQK